MNSVVPVHPESKSSATCNLCFYAVLVLLTSSPVWAQTTEPIEGTAHNVNNVANNPVTPKITFEAQNYLSPSPQGEGGKINDEELFRLYLPFKLAHVQNILRFYQPVDRTVDPQDNGVNGGLGDTTIYDLALTQKHDWTLGLGPLAVLPSGSHSNMTANKFQVGAAGIFLHEAHWGMSGAVVTYQHSLSDYGSSRPADELLTVQPQMRFNLKHHFYLRSTGFWNIDWDTHVSEIPVGLGLGKIWTLHDGTTLNFYVEPQPSVYHTGTGSDVFQTLIGLNIQLPKNDRLFGHHS